MRMLLMIALLLPVAAARADADLNFAVLRDGAPIGTHRVQIDRRGDETLVSTSISLDVSLAFVPLYSYRHQSVETWRGDRLVRLESRTDDNGEKMRVLVVSGENGLTVDGPDGRRLLPADTVPTSYWNPALVADRPLLDSQNGRLLDVDRLAVSPGRWRLAGELNLDISYGPGGTWSGLWFRHKGSDFAYHPTFAPAGVP